MLDYDKRGLPVIYLLNVLLVVLRIVVVNISRRAKTQDAAMCSLLFFQFPVTALRRQSILHTNARNLGLETGVRLSYNKTMDRVCL